MKKFLVAFLGVVGFLEVLTCPLSAKTPLDQSSTQFLQDEDLYVDTRHLPLEEEVSPKH